MDPQNVPEELIRVGVKAIADRMHEDLCACTAWPDSCTNGCLPRQWEHGDEAEFLAAVLPAHEATVRAKVAEDLKADLALSNREMTDLRELVDVFAEGDQDELMDLVNATGRVWLAYAARIARDGQGGTIRNGAEA